MVVRFRVTRKRLAVLVVATALLIAGAIGYAAIPDSAGVYTACMLNGDGTIRIIDPAATPASLLLNHCTSLETRIRWNQGELAGPHGPPGDKGATGDKGPTGDEGSTGDRGSSWSAGTSGWEQVIGGRVLNLEAAS